MGALGVAYFKRHGPHSVHGRTYDTLMPRYWQTAMVLWDYSLSAPVHALLDPTVMNASLERWMPMVVYQHFETKYLTGSAIGPWYAVNAYALVNMAYTYLHCSGDLSWLAHRVDGKDPSVQAYLIQYALDWKQFKQTSGLAGYGDLNNLLECVSSYAHEVAALNAANVFSMKAVADMAEPSGDVEQAGMLHKKAAQLAERMNQLYVEGKGYWKARQPDGTLREVRYAYDLLTILNTIPEDLTAKEKAEMVAFFRRELQTEAWMHALSPKDDDVLCGVPPDHQWTGSYPPWPPETARGLYRIGEVVLAFSWLKGLGAQC